MKQSRREFLIQGSTAVAAAGFLIGGVRTACANPLGRPIGLQLYTVMEQLGKDFDGTLTQIFGIGYREVEMAGFFGKKPAEIKQSLDNAGLHCASVHIFPPGGAEEALEYAAVIGAKYVISSAIPPEHASVNVQPGKFNANAFVAALNSLTLDDYRSMAEQCNKLGEKAKQAGLQFGYHNHNFEFRPFTGGIGYDELLRSTDPELVKLELDCGWMVIAGHDPVAYIRKFPGRYRLLHIKDFKPTTKPSFDLDRRPESAPLGRGHIDYKPIFAAAKQSSVEWYYVEQEPPYKELSAMETIKVNYEYLHAMD
jgi:sugar phosphate isomerase/epimerase